MRDHTLTKSRFLRIVMSVLMVSALVFSVMPMDKSYAAAKKAKVTYSVNGGKFVAQKYTKKKTYSVKKTVGKKIGKLPKAKRTGYALTGWFTKKTKGKKVTKNYVIKKNIKIFAHWKAKQYSLKFNASGGSVDTASKKITYNKSYGKLPEAEKDGYIFSGWFTQAYGGKIVTEKTKHTVAKNVTVYAQWEAIKPLTNLPMSDAVENMIAKTDSSTEKYAYDVMDRLAYGEFKDDATGFRTAGSDSEKAAASWIASEFKDIGLTKVQRIPVRIDKWQFNDATFKMTYEGENGSETLNITNADDNMISYAASGTVQSKADFDWENLEIVDMNEGTKWDYEDYYETQGLVNDADRNMDGKIVLASIDQFNGYWIDSPYNEAFNQGAAALITYQSTGGYGQYGASGAIEDWDTVNVQDICTSDHGIPCLSISPRDANKIQKALEANDYNGTNPANVELYVDNVVRGKQTSYNVVGMIKGSGDTGQQVLYAGHYDKYFYSFQDDCSAIGMLAGIAKAMVDSKYQPINDIIFVAHGSEEWGQAGAAIDWAQGSWKMITEAKPEWQGTTLGIINYELCAGKVSGNTIGLSGTREILPMLQGFKGAGLLDTYRGKVHPTINTPSASDASGMTDEVSYQFNGVPVFKPGQGNAYNSQQRYHTQYDDRTTYDADTVDYKIMQDAALGMYIDNTPALVVDIEQRVNRLIANAALPAGSAAGMKADYQKSAAELTKAAKELKAKAEELNAAYIKAYQNYDEDAMDTILEKATALNEISLEAFRMSQDEFVGLATYTNIQPYHQALNGNINKLNNIISGIDGGTFSEAFLYGTVGSLWAEYEFQAIDFSEDSYYMSKDSTNNESVVARGESNWSVDKMVPMLDTYESTSLLVDLVYDTTARTPANIVTIKAGYKEALDELKDMYDESVSDAIRGMDVLSAYILNSL